MIELYSGTPGSGKSFHCARRVYNNLVHTNRLVISNVSFNLDTIKKKFNQDRFCYFENNDISPTVIAQRCRRYFEEYAPDGRIKEGQVLVVLDEAQLLFNARTWQANDNKGWIAFFTQHRKLGCDILMIAQNDRMIDRQIRSLIEYEVIHRKLNRFGWKGRIFSLLFGDFVAVHTWYGVKEIVQREFIRYSRRVSKLYDTYQLWK